MFLLLFRLNAGLHGDGAPPFDLLGDALAQLLRGARHGMNSLRLKHMLDVGRSHDGTDVAV
jgi:hypothetical protein